MQAIPEASGEYIMLSCITLSAGLSEVTRFLAQPKVIQSLLDDMEDVQ